ncbi:YopX family protein [Elizabethkingia anophelis]|uniref:YopX family protein n=1 Tax=Elizabethkingia anophelis TaxID=1117645 RepID=UPI0024072D29|nr:YopX family protein [Elizabethkingia anophelis]
MREILFRGKRVDNNEWVYGYLRSYDEINNYYVDKKTVGQFTGLLDKNGNKIFEGDILNVPERMFLKEGKLIKSDNTVYFENGMLKCNNLSLCTYMNYLELEITGNIHQSLTNKK